MLAETLASIEMPLPDHGIVRLGQDVFFFSGHGVTVMRSFDNDPNGKHSYLLRVNLRTGIIEQEPHAPNEILPQDILSHLREAVGWNPDWPDALTNQPLRVILPSL